MESNLAENLDHADDEGNKPDKNPDLKLVKPGDEEDLTESEYKELKYGKITRTDLALKRKQARKAAEDELNSQLRRDQIQDEHYQEYLQKLDNTTSPQKTKELHEEIRNLPKTIEENKKKEAEQKKEDGKELDPSDKKLLTLEKAFVDDIEKNRKYLGEIDAPEWIKWAKDQRLQNPTVAHMKTVHENFMEGKSDNNLGPRKKVYQDLEDLFKKYGKSVNPQNSTFVKKEGLKGRREFLKNAKEMEKHIDQYKHLNLYPPEIKKEAMEKMLDADTPLRQKEMQQKLENLTRDEMKALSSLDNTVTINGVTTRMMSKKSKKELLEYHRSLSVDHEHRQNPSNKWQGYLDAEAELTRELAKVYKEDRSGFKAAIGSFEELGYQEKQKELATHKTLVKNTENKETRETQLIVKAAHAKIETAGNEKTLGPKSVKLYKAFFDDEKNYHDNNKEKPDLDKLRKMYDTLTNSTPNPKSRNIAAYAEERTKFSKQLSELEKVNPDIKPAELTTWQSDYDKNGWKRRAIVATSLEKEIKNQAKEQRKRKEQEVKAELTQEEKDTEQKEKVSNISLDQGLTAVKEHLKFDNPQGAEAMKLLLALDEKYKEDEEAQKTLKFWFETVGRFIAQFGTGEKAEKTTEAELEKEVEKITEEETIKDKLEELQEEELATELSEVSFEKHHKTSTFDRSEITAKQEITDEEELTLTEQFLERARGDESETLTLDKEGKAAKILEVDFDEKAERSTEKKNKTRKKLSKEQQKLEGTRKGSEEVKLKKKGREITHKEAKIETKHEREKLEKKIQEKAEERTARHLGRKKTSDGNVFDLNERIAAARKAKEEVKKKTDERIERRAS